MTNDEFIPEDVTAGIEVGEEIPETPVSIPWSPPLQTPSPIFPPGGPSMSGSRAPAPTTPGVDPTVKMIANLLALILAGGGAAGIGQQLFGRPPATTVTPRMSPQALQAFGGAQQQFGQSGGILQALLGNIQNPQIPPGLSLLTEQAFQPQMGNLYSQAAQAGRLRGFHDAPATSPPGGAILGPGLANLQGQMAQAKLNLYQNNIGNLLQALQGSQALGQGQGQLAVGLPAGQRTQPPQPSILQAIQGAIPIGSEIGKILAAVNPPPTPQMPPEVSRWLMANLSGT